jgi:hypothetical protein
MALTDKKMNSNISNWNTCFGKTLADSVNADVTESEIKLRMGAMGDAIIDLILSLNVDETSATHTLGLNSVDVTSINPHAHTPTITPTPHTHTIS